MYTYLILNLLSISVPLWRSFDKRISLNKDWRLVVISIMLPATFFIIWDIWFTEIGIWGFNPDYLCGLYIGGLPIEEWLFFVCIPYACLFTYVALNYFIKKDYLLRFSSGITVSLIIGLALVAFLNIEKAYTFSTFISLAIFLLFLKYALKVTFLGRFYIAYGVILIPFFIVNGILTGTGLDEPIVWYNNSENLFLRMGTIPVEATFYGMLLILMNVTLFHFLKKRSLNTSQTKMG